MMKCCLLFLFLLLSGQNSVGDNTLKTTFDNGFADWKVQNQSWVTKNWQEIKKNYNGTLPEPSITNSVRLIFKSVMKKSLKMGQTEFVLNIGLIMR